MATYTLHIVGQDNTLLFQNATLTSQNVRVQVPKSLPLEVFKNHIEGRYKALLGRIQVLEKATTKKAWKCLCCCNPPPSEDLAKELQFLKTRERILPMIVKEFAENVFQDGVEFPDLTDTNTPIRIFTVSTAKLSLDGISIENARVST